MQHDHGSLEQAQPRLRWPALAVWGLGWAVMFALDDRIDLANKAQLLVLTAAVAAIWSGPWVSLLAGAAAVLAFNFAFVPPRGTFTVDLHQHALLLVTMLSVSSMVALLVARLRWHAAQATAHAMRSDQLRQLGDALRAADDPMAQAAALREVLSRIGGSTVALWLSAGVRGDEAPDGPAESVGPISPDEATGLRLAMLEGRAMGPGTGRHEEQPAWYLPLRGRHGTQGAALLRLADGAARTGELLRHAQALCDQLGAALERSAAMRAAAAAREQAQGHALRNTLLAAISHDHRTPLATIVGAASALHDQDDRLSAAQRRQLAATIVDEASQLSRLTENTLQLARLGSARLVLQRDWESVEEIVGTALRRIRQRHAGQRIKARVEPGLPLLRCDAVLMVQLLDNLVDNALKHGGADAPIEVLARRMGEKILLAVRDRGPGVPPAMQDRIFETFQRADAASGAGAPNRGPRGAGVGLALCQAIARAHDGELRLRRRGHGGSSFELLLPVQAMPDAVAEPDDPGAGT